MIWIVKGRYANQEMIEIQRGRFFLLVLRNSLKFIKTGWTVKFEKEEQEK